MKHVLLYLSNGKKIKGLYDEGDFDGIYEDWDKGDMMGFHNCCVKGTEVIGMEYEDVPSDVPVEIPGEVLPYWNAKGKLVLSHKDVPDNMPKPISLKERGSYCIFKDTPHKLWCVRSNYRADYFYFNDRTDAEDFRRLIELAR
jgi:hypothetical protein